MKLSKIKLLTPIIYLFFLILNPLSLASSKGKTKKPFEVTFIWNKPTFRNAPIPQQVKAILAWENKYLLITFSTLQAHGRREQKKIYQTNLVLEKIKDKKNRYKVVNILTGVSKVRFSNPNDQENLEHFLYFFEVDQTLGLQLKHNLETGEEVLTLENIESSKNSVFLGLGEKKFFRRG